MKGKHLLSKAFSSNHHIDKITAVYTPFWLFDATAHASIDFTGVNTTTWSDDDYDYIKSDYYDIYTKGKLSFAHIAACATSKIPLSYMESIEPFDFSKAVPFKTAYLAGYLAERYNIDTGSCLSREMKRIKSSTTSAISSTIREYMSVSANIPQIPLGAMLSVTHLAAIRLVVIRLIAIHLAATILAKTHLIIIRMAETVLQSDYSQYISYRAKKNNRNTYRG